MKMHFPTSLKEILQRIESIDPIAYGRSRNYLNGSVTYLSPYISRGVISTRQILASLIQRGYAYNELEILIKELLWREFFQRTWQNHNIDQDIRFPQQPIAHVGIPKAISEANTGIEAIDQSIRQLLSVGYMHNHNRMYLASVVCNVAQYAWLEPARWMYYHLLDGDWASNACSWQWVAGANSTKKYYANQENINTFCNTTDKGTFLDCSYEQLPLLEIPGHLKENQHFHPITPLPSKKELNLNKEWPTLIYNYYNLDPVWHAGKQANRILLLEPSIFDRYPVSEHCMAFALSLADNIPGIQIFTGSFEELISSAGHSPIYFKEHPLNSHYCGIAESRNWIQSGLTKPATSFSGFYKSIKTEIESTYF